MFAVEASPCGGVRVRALADAVQANWLMLEEDQTVSAWSIVAVEKTVEAAVEKQKAVKALMKKGKES